MTLEDIATVRGTLKQCFEQVDPTTILHSDEIQEKRLADKEFRKLGSWTADFPLYTTIEGKEAVLYIARRDNNLVLQNLDNAVEQILKTRNYKISSEDAQKVIAAESTLKIPLSMLRLERHDDEWSYFTINTSKYEKLNAVEEKFAERVHGSGEQFGKVMEMLAGSNIKETRIYTLNPNYVKNNAKENPIARVCWLSVFDYDSFFSADYRNVDYSNGALRGVRREKVVAEGDARENADPFAQIKEAIKAGKPFDYEGKRYVPEEHNNPKR